MRLALAALALLVLTNVALAGSGERKKREKLAAQLDAARREALAAIFDEAIYRSEDHGRSGQANVDAKVDVVRGVWSHALPLLGSDAATVEKLPAAKRSAFLASSASGWEGLVQAFVLDRAVLRANEKVALPAHEREQVRLTNEYRIMMGRRALVLDERLATCARGHSAEMTRLGYFAHESPTAGRKTMSDRARLVGVTGALGENIAKGYDSPARAHEGWYRSAGHHRNVLGASWTRMGSGKDGAHWTQNYAG